MSGSCVPGRQIQVRRQEHDEMYGYFREVSLENSIFEEVIFEHKPDGSASGNHGKVQGKDVRGRTMCGSKVPKE